MEKSIPLKIISSNLTVYGVAHGVVDAACAGIVVTLAGLRASNQGWVLLAVIAYNLFAFGLQAPLGFLVDRLKAPRAAAAVGCLSVCLALLVFRDASTVAVVLAGFGNALFHVGGGSISLNLIPTKASAPGIFVAPGAIGLFVGAFIAKSGNFSAWPFILALAVLCALMFLVQRPEMDYRTRPIAKEAVGMFWVILLFVLFSIAIRSLVGMAVSFPWKADVALLVTLIVAVVLGKGLGGILADRFGWIRVAVGALLLSIPLLLLGPSAPVAGIVGMFLFNVTMPVTLVAVSNLLPGRPAFAFGLTCLALILGALPSLLRIDALFRTPIAIGGVILISATVLYAGLVGVGSVRFFRHR